MTLARDLHGGHDDARLPALERVDHVDARELLEDGVVLLVAQEVQERAELGPPRQLALRELAPGHGAEDLADGAADEAPAAVRREVGLLVSPKGTHEAEAEEQVCHRVTPEWPTAPSRAGR